MTIEPVGQMSDALTTANLTTSIADSNTNVGIVGLEIYVPKKCVDQEQLETFDGVASGKYTIGLGQKRMAFVDDREDINSICLTVVQSLVEKYGVSYADIGRLEVGTETIIDKSKSVKSVLMQLLAASGNSNVEGVDTTNACYGGTNALFNAINWLESPYWDGRYAIVVAADIAVYKNGAARPTGGAGAVAMLLGRNAPIVFDRGLRVSHMEHVYDFYKPDLHSEYPEVDGPLSNVCYIKALDTCYNRYLDKVQKKTDDKKCSTLFDFMLFHCPYTKLVQKSYARMSFNDFRRNSSDASFAEFSHLANVPIEQSYGNREIEKAFMSYTKDAFDTKVAPGLVAAKNIGNMYCASLYGGLASLISNVSSDDLINKRIGLFSYGSGLASSMFSVTVRAPVDVIAKNLNLNARLESRTIAEPKDFDLVMQLRQDVHNAKNYAPQGAVDEANLFKGTYYLENVDDKFRRQYVRFNVGNF